MADISFLYNDEFHKKLIEKSTYLLQIIDKSGRFIYVNDRWKKRLGYLDDEIKSIRIWDILSPECFSCCQEIFSKAIKGIYTTPVSGALLTKNKEIVKCEVIILGTTTYKDTDCVVFLLREELDSFDDMRSRHLMLIEMARGLIEKDVDEVTYQDLTENILKLSGAKYAGFNMFNDDSTEFTTVGLAGVNSHILVAAGMLGFDPLGKTWDYDPHKSKRIRGKAITEFDSLKELTGDIIPKGIIMALEKMFDLGKVLVVSITKDDKAIGDFTIMMQKGKSCTDKELLLVYASLAGLFIEKQTLQRVIKENIKVYDLAIGATGAGIWDYDMITKKVCYADKWISMLGYKRNEIEDSIEGWRKLWHPDETDMIEKAMDDYLSGKTHHYEVIHRLKHKDGNYMWIMTRGTVLRHEDGTPYRWVGTNIDLTQIKKAQDQITEKNQRLENIIQGTNAGTWEWNVQTGEMIINERWADLIGYTLSELEPVDITIWVKFAHPDDLEKSNMELRLVFEKKKEYYSSRCRMRHKNGNWIWVSDSAKVMSWTEDGEPLWMHGTHIDITEPVHKEALLEEKTNLLTAVLNSIQEGIAVIEPDFSISYSNIALKSWIGQERLSQNGKCHMMLRCKDAVCESCPTEKCFKTGLPQKAELIFPTVTGDKLTEVYSYPIKRQGSDEVTGVVEFIRDITQSRLLEEKLRDSEEQHRLLVSQMQQGLAVHEIICNEEGRPVDYRFLQVNKKFEELTGLKAEDIIGRTLLEILPSSERYWIDLHGHVALTGESYIFENYAKELGKWFRVSAYAPKPMQFAIITDDITEYKKAEKEIKHKTKELERFFSVNLDLLCIADIEGHFIRVNKSWEKTLGYPIKYLEGRKFLEFVHPDDMEKTIHILKNLAGQSEVVNFVNRYRCKDGSYRFIEWRSHPYGNLVYAAARDITEKRKMEEILYIEKELFKTTLLSVADGVISTDEAGNIAVMNKVAQSLIGVNSDEAYNKPFDDIFEMIDEKGKTPVKELVKKVLETKSVMETTDALLISKRGFEIPIETRTSPIINSEGSITGTVTVFRDYTEKRQKQREVEYLSLHDHLTGLYNRRYMEDAIKRLDTKRNLPFAIMVIDINGLKLTNDAFGHATGDLLLKTVSDVIRKTCRTDDIISRVGGDEFVLLLPKTDMQEADRLKHRLIETSEDVRLDSLVVSLAIGYCVKTDPEQSIIEVQRIADNNMYKNKLKHGKIMRSQTIETVLRNINHKYDKEQIHTERVSLYCERLGKAMGLGQKDIEKLKIAGILHDIGKIMVPAEILNKESKLRKDEWDEIRRHPVTSYNILKGVEEYANIAELVLYHHERWDGKGYPQKLKGEEIPLLSRILTVADAYEAMTAQRNYQKSRSVEEAAAELLSCAGTQFDPEIVKVFVEKVI